MKNLRVSFFIATGSHLIYSTVYAILVFIFGINKDIYGKSVGFYFYYSVLAYFQLLLYAIPLILVARSLFFSNYQFLSMRVIYYTFIIVLYPIAKSIVLREKIN